LKGCFSAGGPPEAEHLNTDTCLRSRLQRSVSGETYIIRQCCPVGAPFSERSLGKSLVSIFRNPIMFAQDLCHSQIVNMGNSIDLN